MFRSPTVFIIGAGCSKEFGFPDGWTLRKAIRSNIPTPPELIPTAVGQAYLAEFGGDINRLGTDARQLLDGINEKPSVDQYLEFHDENRSLVFLGKLVLCQSILEAEASNIGNILQPGEVYLEPLAHAMNAGARLRNPAEMFSNVSFITFNYERAIEAFFGKSVAGLTGSLEVELIRNVLSNLDVVHTYGQVGRLPAVSVTPLNRQLPPVSLGGHCDSHALSLIAKQITTFSETLSDKFLGQEVQRRLDAAHQIVFLGFSYIEENMRLLEADTPFLRRVIMLQCGMSPPDKNYALYLVNSAFRTERPRLINAGKGLEILNFDQTAFAFMSDWGRALARF